jgi:DNA-directed RNA polymerase specialized sigma subunit
MGIKSRKAVSIALKALSEDIEDLQRNDERQDKILDAQAKEIAELQKTVMKMRDAAIAADAKSRVPYEDISNRYGISKGRISQIKKSFETK